MRSTLPSRRSMRVIRFSNSVPGTTSGTVTVARQRVAAEHLDLRLTSEWRDDVAVRVRRADPVGDRQLRKRGPHFTDIAHRPARVDTRAQARAGRQTQVERDVEEIVH